MWIVGILGISAFLAVDGERNVVDRIVARVDNDIITLRELEDKAAPFLANLGDRTRDEVLRKVLDAQIDERVMDREIDRNRERLGVSEADVDRAIEEVLRINNFDRPQLQSALYAQGLTWGEYRKQLKDQIARARLVQFKVQGKIEITEDAVQRLCNQRADNGTDDTVVCVAHILRKVPDGASPEYLASEKVRMAQLQAELRAGADFKAAATRESDDTSTTDGALGCFSRGEMLPEMEQATFDLAVGEISNIVRTDLGVHLFRVTERRYRAAATCSAPEDLAPFREELYQRELEAQMAVWMRTLRKQVFVEVRL